MRTKSCELCGASIEYPGGLCLPVNLPSMDVLLKEMANLHAMIDAGLIGATQIRRFNYFVCESCVNRLHQENEVTPDKLELEMARNKGHQFWNSEIREKIMRPDEFTYPFPLDISLLSQTYATRAINLIKQATSIEEKVSIYANVVARDLQFRRWTPPSILSEYKGQRVIAIIAESQFMDTTDSTIGEFTQRWLLKDVGRSTVIYFAPYHLPQWFSYQIASHLALSISYNVPEAENRLSEHGGLSWSCYVNSNNGHCMAIFWE